MYISSLDTNQSRAKSLIRLPSCTKPPRSQSNFCNIIFCNSNAINGNCHTGHFLPKLEIKDYREINDGRSFFGQLAEKHEYLKKQRKEGMVLP